MVDTHYKLCPNGRMYTKKYLGHLAVTVAFRLKTRHSLSDDTGIKNPRTQKPITMRNIKFLASLLILSMGFGMSATAQDASGDISKATWLVDDITGCKVWNSAPQGNETISWSGPCQNDKASGNGVLVWFEDGKVVGRFTGTMNEGKAEGVGKLYFEVEDGFAYYHGDFKKSEMHGTGVLVFPDKSKAEGDFRNDKMNGFIKATLTDGGSYEGEVKDNLPHGKGRQINPEGEEYFGTFVNGIREGEGTLLLTNGDIYKGQMKNDLAEGVGELSTADGQHYKGAFKEGLPHGKGVYTAPDGEVARGKFVNGEPEGTIVFTLKDGGTRDEIWNNGKQVKQ